MWEFEGSGGLRYRLCLIVAAMMLCVAAMTLFAARAEAQDCAHCETAASCERDDYGTDDCDFNGFCGFDEGGFPVLDCCRQVGAACNPTAFLPKLLLPVVPDDQLRVLSDGTGMKTAYFVQVERGLFVTWSCAGVVASAHEEQDGGLIEVDAKTLAELRTRYPLDRFLSKAVNDVMLTAHAMREASPQHQ